MGLKRFKGASGAVVDSTGFRWLYAVSFTRPNNGVNDVGECAAELNAVVGGSMVRRVTARCSAGAASGALRV